MGKKKAGVVCLAILAAAGAAGGIWYFLENDGKDSNDRVYVEKVSAVMGNATGVQNRYSGVVQPQETVDVNTDSERTVGEVLVAVGDSVEEGQLLFRYDTDEVSLELEQAKLELENQDIEISNYNKQIQELETERKAAPEADRFEYTTQIQTIQTQIKQAEFEKSSKKLEMDRLQKKVDNADVTSPASGVIKSINDGNSPEAEYESSAFITILSTGEYRIKGKVNEQNAGMITSGTSVIIRSRVDEEVTWGGTVDRLDTEESSGSSDNNMISSDSDGEMNSSSSYPFYVTLDDAEGLMLGQHVIIELDEGQTEAKEGIWLYSGYIVFDEAGDGQGESIEGASEWGGSFDMEPAYSMAGSSDMEDSFDDSLYGDDTEDWSDYETDTEDWSDYLTDLMPEYGSEAGMPQEGSAAFVWADDGNGRLEKRPVVLGEYDGMLDMYEILSGLTEDDLIAWPMEGLYEGVKTVTDMEEVDYSSGLYNQNGTEGMMDDGMMDEGFDGMEYDESMDSEFSEEYIEDSENTIYSEDGTVDEGYDEDGSGGDASYESDGDGQGSAGGSEEESGGLRGDDKKVVELEDFLKAGERQ